MPTGTASWPSRWLKTTSGSKALVYSEAAGFPSVGPGLLLVLIHSSAWKVNSPKSNFRFTEFAELRQEGFCIYPLRGMHSTSVEGMLPSSLTREVPNGFLSHALQLHARDVV